ncbi:hypothetical protein MMC30_008497 [Trapelia coarctata]|nr:hypothetical protein [Trapelia coarctata]
MPFWATTLEGPVLAREYLQDQEKTAKAFIQDPAWSSSLGGVQRLYKTGDLVKFNVDGNIVFCGRKDNQIKLNGQRIELGEIESRLLLHERIQHAVVVLPIKGSCKNRLVAVVLLADLASSALGESVATSKNACTLIQGSRMETAQSYLREVRGFLAETLPAYMIPAMWAIAETVPIIVSGKADKKQIGEGIKGLDSVAYKQLTAHESISIDSAELTKTAQRLREIWAAVFDRPLKQVDPGRSFMSQGGDSLQSMSIVSRCRKTGLAKSIDSDKTSVKPTNASSLKEKVDQPFELSPVQQLYIGVAGPSSDHTRNGRFNQSQMLKVNRHTSTGAIRHALESIVKQHSMFRAKFSRNQHGIWQQKIASTTTNAYRLQTHQVDDLQQMVPVVAESQTCLDIKKGPLLARNLERRTLFSGLGAADVETFIQDYICPKIGVFRGGITDVLLVTDFQALTVTGAMLKSRWMLNYFFFDGQGHLDLIRLKRAVFKLVQSFDILRTVFVYYGDRFWQVVLRKLGPQFQVYETEEDFDVFTRNLHESSIKAYPRLGEAYVQVSVVRKTGTNAHRIMLRLSHAQYDGICLPKIIKALKVCYGGKEVMPSPSYSNYVLQATGPANRNSYDYWKALLRGSSMTSVRQREQPNYNVSDQATSVVKKTIKLPALNSKNVKPSTIFKAAWALTLAQLTGKSDIVFGNLISGRNAAVYGVENIVGPCVNIVPVRIALGSKATALNLLRMIQGQQVASMPHESLGFREFIQQCTDWPEWTYFSSVVQHQNISQEMPLRLDGRRYKVGSSGRGDNLSDFTLLSTPKEGGTVEVALGACGGGTIPAPLVKRALDMTCSFAESFARSPGDTLPSFLNDPNRKGLAQLQDPVQASEQERPSSPSLTTNLRGIRKREIYDMVDILRRSWRVVLPKDRQLSSSEINPDTSFYSLGGDIIAMGALCASLRDDGYTDIRLEDLIKRSTMGEQIALLSSQARSRR